MINRKSWPVFFKGLLLAIVLALIPISAYGTEHAGPKTPSCGNYKVTKNEVEEPAEEEEPVFVDKMVPHSYPILPEETKHNVRLLSKE